MSDNRGHEESAGRTKTGNTARILLKAEKGTDCIFCWFLLRLYPMLNDVTPRDAATYQAHLKKSHGLRDDIER